MKVIANGNTNQVECEKCHAKLEFDKYDLRWTHTEEDYYYIECPICHEMIWLKSTKELDQSGRFDYRPEYKKYVLNTDVHFDTAKYELKNLHGDLDELRDAGREIQQFLKKHDQYSYLVIIG